MADFNGLKAFLLSMGGQTDSLIASIATLRSDMETADGELQEQIDGVKSNYVTSSYDEGSNTVILTAITE